jgi:hypothetical protein
LELLCDKLPLFLLRERFIGLRPRALALDLVQIRKLLPLNARRSPVI